MKIENRTFVISGGASGLGRATTLDLFAKGGYIAILDLNEELAKQVISATSSSKVRFFETDVTNSEQVAASVKAAAAWSAETKAPFGGIIAAAGVGKPALTYSRQGPLNLDGFKFVIDINLIGTVDLIRNGLEYLTKVDPEGADGERGVVIMVASAAAYEGQSGQLAYSASKGGVVSMTLPMARDLSKYGIRVLTLAPSMFDSPMTEKMPPKVKESLLRSMEFPKRPGKPHEFSQVAIACIESTMLNGEIIRLDGASRMPARL
ncbi:hypothetical protein H072_2306 [Dactylellina haptotyla CBS 200.50]|uniref:3-hydroxyacyl-CoA dehydrogenase type-2 n=1 Tax=Dactylellina haptotyla (strain CBS 200.50) TaxID=1284197 RepID=S8BW27_DACHA|nr:hypothetical protein H072_2306 [Dactylellina haptotyla CBS 200.50]